MPDINFQGETEQSIVAALRQGRQDVLSKLYDAYAPLMMGVIVRIVRDEEVAEEVLKETFIAIWSRIGIYDESKNKLLTWGLAIARGISLEAVKTSRYSIKTNPENKHQLNGTEKNKNETSGEALKINHSLCTLDAKEKEALESLYLKGRTCAETAAELNITQEALRVVIKKALIHLKAEKSA